MGKITRILLLILAMSFAVSLWGQKTERSKLSADSILIGDQIVWTLDFSVPEGSILAIGSYAEILARDTSIRGAVEPVTDFELDTLGIKDKMAQLRAKILLTSFDSGSFTLPSPLIVVGKNGRPDTLRFDSKNLYVNTIPIDTASFKPYDIKGQETYPITFSEILPWILLVLLIALIIFAIIRFIAMKKKNKDFFGRKMVVEPPHITALKKIEKIRGDKLWQAGKHKAYYTGITDALREYMEKRYGFGAMEKTSSEIIEALSDKQIDQTVLSDLTEMFQIADLVKFAKLVPSEDVNEKAVPSAVNFVNFAYMQQLRQNEDDGRSAKEGTNNEKEGK